MNFNRYWYGNDNPYRFTDPDGRYTCSNQDSCAAARAGVSAINAALKNHSSPRDHAALVAAKNFYGREGQSNGVHVEAGDRDATVTTADQSEPGGLRTVVTLNVGNSEGIAAAAQQRGMAGVNLGALLGETLVHESVHGTTQRSIQGMLTVRSELRTDEVNGYTAQALFDHAAGINPWGYLNSRGEIDDAAIGAAADRSVNAACSEPGAVCK